MKNIRIIGLLIIALIGLNSCDQEDDLVFTAQEPTEGINFSNTFLEEYVLTVAASKNLGERFTWNDANFGVPTNVTYELENSILGDFTDATTISTTSGNELAVTIGQMLGFAEAAGLDNDPDTDNPNTGELYFRIKASVGIDNGLPTYSNIQELTVVLPEIVVGGGGAFEIASWGVVGSSLGDANNDGVLDTDNDNNIAVTAGNYKITIDTNNNAYTIEPFSWGVVGSGYNDWGSAGPDAKFYYDYTTDTFKVGVKLLDGEIKFRMNNAWDVALGDATADGVLDTDADNNIASVAGHYLITLNLNDNTYTVESANIYGVVGSGFNDWGGAGPDAALTEIQPGVWFAENITLLDGEIKFRQNNAWDVSYGDATGDNILDTDSDNNIASTAGNYVISIDFNDPEGPKYLLGKR